MKYFKFIGLYCILLFSACSKEEIIPIPEPVQDIFKVSEAAIINGNDVSFELENEGIYILKLVEVETSQVISKEKITLIKGKNTVKIFTRSISNQYLYLVLENMDKVEIKKTKLKLY